jgi:hypothetical protein
MYSGLQYVFKGGLGILQMLMWRYHFSLIFQAIAQKDSSRFICFISWSLASLKDMDEA